jgi:hypothetical protein
VFRHFYFLEDTVTKIIFLSSHFSKGISQSALPYRRSVPSWLKLNSEDVKEQIKKLGKKGMTPSQIGKQKIREFSGSWIFILIDIIF